MKATPSWQFLKIPNADGTFSILLSDRLPEDEIHALAHVGRFRVIGPSPPLEPPANVDDREFQQWLDTLSQSGYEINGV